MPILLCQSHWRSRNVPAWAKSVTRILGHLVVFWRDYTVCYSAAIFHHIQPDNHVQQIKAKVEQEGERHKNDLWWDLLNEGIIPRRKLKPGLLWVVRNSSKPSGKTNTRMFCPDSERLNVYKLIVKSCLTLIFHKNIQFVCDINSFLECHFQIVCKSLRQVTSAQTACLLVFLIWEIKAE